MWINIKVLENYTLHASSDFFYHVRFTFLNKASSGIGRYRYPLPIPIPVTYTDTRYLYRYQTTYIYKNICFSKYTFTYIYL